MMQVEIRKEVAKAAGSSMWIGQSKVFIHDGNFAVLGKTAQVTDDHYTEFNVRCLMCTESAEGPKSLRH